jgi:two-component sensor histidine kinase
MTPANFNIGYMPEQIRKAVTPLLDGSRETLVITSQHQRADGSTYPVEVHIHRVRSGMERYLLGVAHDITDRVLREQELEETNARLRQALHDNEMLLREIHHRVKNNLSLVASLLNLQTDLVHDPRDADLLLEARSRVMTIARIHENLYRSTSLNEVNAVEYLQSIACQVIRSGPRQGIDLVVSGDAIVFSTETAVPLGLMLNELVTNSLKHAFTDRQAGMITILLRRNGGDCLMTYRDNGAGLPTGLDPDHAETLGHTLVASLVRQLSGTMTMATDNGARFDIRFPVG